MVRAKDTLYRSVCARNAGTCRSLLRGMKRNTGSADPDCLQQVTPSRIGALQVMSLKEFQTVKSASVLRRSEGRLLHIFSIESSENQVKCGDSSKCEATNQDLCVRLTKASNVTSCERVQVRGCQAPAARPSCTCRSIEPSFQRSSLTLRSLQLPLLHDGPHELVV